MMPWHVAMALASLALAPVAAAQPMPGLVPVCTSMGISWVGPDGQPVDGPGKGGAQGCAHLLCERGNRKSARP